MSPSFLSMLAIVVPSVAVYLSRRGTQKQLIEVHGLVNDRLTKALDTIKSLEAEVRGLKEVAGNHAP